MTIAQDASCGCRVHNLGSGETSPGERKGMLCLQMCYPSGTTKSSILDAGFPMQDEDVEF